MQKEKELLLLRHGKSDWNNHSSDFNRPLNTRGQRNAQQMGEWLLQQQLVPDLVISSPAERALTTAQIVCAAMGISAQSIQTDRSIYEANINDLQQVLRQLPESIHRLLLVGHNPGFEYLLSDLAPDIQMPKDRKLMPTATLAYLQLDSQWSALQGNSLIQRAKDLP